MSVLKTTGGSTNRLHVHKNMKHDESASKRPNDITTFASATTMATVDSDGADTMGKKRSSTCESKSYNMNIRVVNPEIPDDIGIDFRDPGDLCD